MDFSKFRVYLRALELEDFKTTINWRKDDEIWGMLAGRKYFVSSEYEKKWVQDVIFNNKNNVTLAICLKGNDRHIGNTYLNDIDWFNRNAESSTLIGEKDCWGKGYGKEATILRLYHGFFELGLERIYSMQLLTNIASIKMLEKCGYCNEGVLRNAVFKNGKYQDLNMMSVLKKDFEELLRNGSY